MKRLKIIKYEYTDDKSIEERKQEVPYKKMWTLPVLEGRTLTAMEVTLAGMSSLLLWYSSPEQTLLLPPSTAHKLESVPANDTAPSRKETNVDPNSLLSSPP